MDPSESPLERRSRSPTPSSPSEGPREVTQSSTKGQNAVQLALPQQTEERASLSQTAIKQSSHNREDLPAECAQVDPEEQKSDNRDKMCGSAHAEGSNKRSSRTRTTQETIGTQFTLQQNQILNAWNDNITGGRGVAYPNKLDVEQLSSATNLTTVQIVAWFHRKTCQLRRTVLLRRRLERILSKGPSSMLDKPSHKTPIGGEDMTPAQNLLRRRADGLPFVPCPSFPSQGRKQPGQSDLQPECAKTRGVKRTHGEGHSHEIFKYGHKKQSAEHRHFGHIECGNETPMNEQSQPSGSNFNLHRPLSPIKQSPHPEENDGELENVYQSPPSSVESSLVFSAADTSGSCEESDSSPASLDSMKVQIVERLHDESLEYLHQCMLYIPLDQSGASGTPGAIESYSGESSQGDGHSLENSNNGNKRKRNGDSDDRKSEEPDDDRSKKRQGKAKGRESSNKRLYACPYFKRDPGKYGRWRNCPGPGWDSVHRVKEHLYSRHTLPIHCPRCLDKFDLAENLLDHQRAAVPCPVKNLPDFEGIDVYQERQLKCRKQDCRSEEAKWVKTYKILFPKDDHSKMPTPYYDQAHREDNHAILPNPPATAELDEGQKKRIEQEIWRIIQDRVGTLFRNAEEAVHNQLPEIVNEAQERVIGEHSRTIQTQRRQATNSTLFRSAEEAVQNQIPEIVNEAHEHVIGEHSRTIQTQRRQAMNSTIPVPDSPDWESFFAAGMLSNSAQ